MSSETASLLSLSFFLFEDGLFILLGIACVGVVLFNPMADHATNRCLKVAGILGLIACVFKLIVAFHIIESVSTRRSLFNLELSLLGMDMGFLICLAMLKKLDGPIQWPKPN
jgi:hypothetical protein